MRRVYNELVSSSFLEECLPLCPYRCDSIYLTKRVSVSTYAKPQELRGLISQNTYLQEKWTNLTYNEMKEHVLKIRIYFGDLQYTYMNQIPKMSATDLISSIGGTLGLFLGMSFLSVFEIFGLLFQLLVFTNKTRRN